MKRVFIVLIMLSMITLLCSCSLPIKLPSNGIWYNEELNISFECIDDPNSTVNNITNVVWNSKADYLYVHIGYGQEMWFYVVDENGNEKELIKGIFKYSDDQIVLTVYEIVQPFDTYGKLVTVDDEQFIFTEISNTTY